MRVISFAFYYVKLLLGVTLKLHQTANPLSLRWRWNFWQSQYAARHGRRRLLK